MEKSPIFEKTYKHYLAQIADLSFKDLEDKLGLQVAGNKAIIHLFGKPYTVSDSGISSPEGRKPHLSTCVILCKYLIMCPSHEPQEASWVSFKDFKDAAPLIHSFAATVSNPISKMFSGRSSALVSVCQKIGGYRPAENFSYDVSICCCCLTTGMKSFRPNARCCLSGEPKITWIWNVSPCWGCSFIIIYPSIPDNSVFPLQNK
jgi:hypothetical protein